MSCCESKTGNQMSSDSPFQASDQGSAPTQSVRCIMMNALRVSAAAIWFSLLEQSGLTVTSSFFVSSSWFNSMTLLRIFMEP